MSLFKSIFFEVSKRIPLNWLLKASPESALFPYHHLVSDIPVPHIENLYSFKNSKEFIKDLDYLLKHFRPMSVEELTTCVKETISLPRNSFLLTFDDGLKEVREVIAPILKQKGVPAIFFVNPAFINNQRLYYRCKISLIIGRIRKGVSTSSLNIMIQQLNLATKQQTKLLSTSSEIASLFDRIRGLDQRSEPLIDKLGEIAEIDFDSYLRDVRPFLTTDDLQQLSADGFTIGAHSWDHPYYTLLSEKEQIEQTIRSVRFVCEHISQDTVHFSFPHSDKSLKQTFFEQINLEKPIIDVFYGIQNQKNEIRNRMIHRFNAERPGIPVSNMIKAVLWQTILLRKAGKYMVNRNDEPA